VYLSGQSSSSKLHGTLPVIPTPFYQGKIDFDSLLRLLDFIFPELDGYTLGGSTGESVSLSIQERLELMRFAAKNAPAGKRVVIGLTHTNLEECKALSRAAADLGLYAGLIPAPYYFPNSLEMAREFIRALDQASDLDLVFYDNPVYTKTWISGEELYEAFAPCRHLSAVKLTDHDLGKITFLRKKGFSVFSGDDVVAFRSLLLGVDGSMIIAPAVFPAAYQRTVGLLGQRNTAGALECFSKEVLPFIHLFGMGDEIVVTKALYEHLGIFRSREARLPLLPATEERIGQVLLAYELCQSLSQSTASNRE
jgi:4-hydroxy-tetrahydrodipicolinate synthase